MRNLKIRRYADTGQFDGGDHDIKNLLESAGPMLNRANASDICGVAVFQGNDGKWYTGCVEFVVSPANPKYLLDVLLDDKVECPSCKHIESRNDCAEDVVDGLTVDRCTRCNAVTRSITLKRARAIIRGK